MNSAWKDALPPVVRLLLEEGDEATLGADSLKPLLPELHRQARWSIDAFDYPSRPRNSMSVSIVPSHDIDPCSLMGGCDRTECQLEFARSFARTLGLWADHIDVPDPLTALLATRQRLLVWDMRRLLKTVRVLRELQPLLEAGVLVFGPSAEKYCSNCYANFVSKVDEASARTLAAVGEDVRATMRGDDLVIQVPHDATGDPQFLRASLDADDRERITAGGSLDDIARGIYRAYVHDRLRAVFLEMKSASRLGATLFSGSRMNLLALREFDDRSHIDSVAAWEAPRSLQLPWVKDLSVQQVIQLREDVGDALPRLRERFFAACASDAEHTQRVASVVQELRAEAEELRSELLALQRNRERQFRNVAGVLGITISVYGFGAGFVPPGVALGSLLSLLGLLHGAERSDASAETKLVARPAYVLFRAREILANSHHHPTDA